MNFKDHKQVMTLPIEDYEELISDRCRLNNVIEHARPASQPADMQAVAEAFMENLDPARVDEWGHISYCYSVALRKMLGD